MLPKKHSRFRHFIKTFYYNYQVRVDYLIGSRIAQSFPVKHRVTGNTLKHKHFNDLLPKSERWANQ